LFSSSGACPDRFEGEHNGYKSLGVKHHRTVQWVPGSGWVILDDILGAGEQDLRLHWLVPDFSHEVSDSPFEVVFSVGQSRIRWSIFSSVAGSAAVVRAGKSSAPEGAGADTQLLGWESPTYGDLRPAVSLVYHTRSQLPVRFVTAVLTDERSRLEPGDGSLVIVRDEAEVFRVNLSARMPCRGNAAPSVSQR